MDDAQKNYTNGTIKQCYFSWPLTNTKWILWGNKKARIDDL